MYDKLYDIVIIGAGTAGLSAAIYAVRAGKKVLVLEEKTYGGQIINTPEVENYPGISKISGFQFATNLYNQAKELGVDVKLEQALNITNLQIATTSEIAASDSNSEGVEMEAVNGTVKEVETDSDKYICNAVIIATGAKNRPLGLPGEKELIGAGVSYCATCDGAFFRGKDVAVVGGGNTALEDALFLSNYCKKVYLIHRRDEFRGEEKQAERLKQKDNVCFVLNSKVVSLRAEDTLQGIRVLNIKDGSTSDIKVDGLFIAIGQMPDNERFSGMVLLDEKGYVVAGEDCKTSCQGVFAAGDCRTKTVRQLTTAAADGAISALGACDFIG